METTMTDEHAMQLALDRARAAADMGEVPIGAVVVCDGRVVAAAHNRRETDRDPAAHAELLAIRDAARALNRWRLSDCTVYVTLEPCPMCAGLMHQARIARCVYGAPDPKAGATGSLYELHADSRLNHRFDVTGGVLADRSATLLRDFFAARRKSGNDTDEKHIQRNEGEHVPTV
ncbi:MAG: tRNA adenosine(34) deaminase TadA [Actinomycetes bacterium]|jgi:tRNA(adenine34) deaminase|nr:tRNA adenosine(34) deaminase TadA [Actinomycetes bacterium]